MLDDFRDGIKTLLNCKVVFVVDSTKEIGSLSGSDKIRCTGKTDSKRVELRPRCKGLLVTNPLARSNSLFSFLPQFFLLLSEPVRFSSGDGSDQTRVKTTRKEDTIRNLRHQPLPDGSFKSFSQKLVVNVVVRDDTLVRVPP